jgi:3-oxoacyl-[acyl-carrier protein] reductase
VDAGLMIDLDGRRALVTGGSRGVGRATALMLAACGARVGIGYRSRSSEADAVVDEIRRAGGLAWAHRADLAEPGAAEALVARCGAEWDGLDILIANAGVWPPAEVAVARMEDAQWESTLRINLDSVFRLVRAAVPLMASDGRIVFVSSTAAQRGEAFHADYAASKGALQSFAKSLAVELGPTGTTVNCVAPGWIDTEMVAGALDPANRPAIERAIPLGRVASADDVAGPITFLCSPLARHVTGEVLNVNGGSVLCG